MASPSILTLLPSSHTILPTSDVKPEVAGDTNLESIVPCEASETPKRCRTIKTTEERTKWLPDGWTMDVRVRTSIKRNGFRDRFYYCPNVRHCFRSKKEVEHFLETGMVRKYKPKSKRAESATDKPQSTLRFDFKNPPAKVRWVLSNNDQGLWTPYINNEEVPESTKNSWTAMWDKINIDTNNL